MEIKAYCDAKEVTVHGTNIPNPILMFDEATFPGTAVCSASLYCCQQTENVYIAIVQKSTIL